MTDDSQNVILVERTNKVGTVTLNRPESLNAVNPPLGAAIHSAMESLRDDPSVWVIIITGSGNRAFSAGADLKWRSENEDAARKYTPNKRRKNFSHPEFNLWKPVIAAVNGYAVGGGLELALSCDIIIAAEHSRFGLPEPRRGLMADTGVHSLIRQLPLKLAMDMLLTGRFITAHEALSHSLINDVVPADRLMERALAKAAEIIECSPLAIQAAKQASVLGRDMPMPDAFTTEFSMFRHLINSDDFTEGPRAFAEKRAPVWSELRRNYE